ncbi:hypothetical protein N7495_009948 [Penicillium taxi]|uniref:uncharacterized protein n=1 Tax=Penicillium taxi TaxID=168475 RepID=UPI002545757E|nr:uncharacterized protein N7495_009948 [Penicillium taxi]KAJ5885438.1 hypothetical protein N7495_009948 [Penicillium taxi]
MTALYTILSSLWILSLLIATATPTQLSPRTTQEQCSQNCTSCVLPSTYKFTPAKRLLSSPSDLSETIEDYLKRLYLSTEWLEMESESSVGESTAAYWELGDETEIIGVGVLLGCVSVVVASHKGIYISHHWEIPAFSTSDWVINTQEQFKNYVLDKIEYGGGSDMPSLKRYTGASGPFKPEYGPKAYVLRRRQSEHEAYDVDYMNRCQELANLVSRLVGVTTEVVAYKNDGTSTVSSAGKAVFQYDPNELPYICSEQTAISRFWVETDKVFEVLWEALDTQLVEED